MYKVLRTNLISLRESYSRRPLHSAIAEVLQLAAEAKEALSPPYHDPLLKPRDSFDFENGISTVNPTIPTESNSTIGTFPDPPESNSTEYFPDPLESNQTTSPDPTTSVSTATFYIVEDGDTFSSIAATLGVTVAALGDADPRVDFDDLQVGELVVIPGSIE
ncbi:carbohydrate-binding module family 50 protein [Stipitochalara longipes BDJ]|nr:carbohydrate-binding module family 50 protein [Stipitochalara longipes BDJ]